jgi:uncharacterized protein (TIGR02246 family)
MNDVRAILKHLEAAENANDADGFVRLMADDVVLIVPDFPMQEGKAAASKFVEGVTEWQRDNLNRHISYTSAEVIVEGTLAFDRGLFAFTVAWKGGGDTETVTGKYMLVYRRKSDKDDWQIWRVMMARDEPEESDEDLADD